MTKEQLKGLKDTITSPLAPGNAVIIMTVTLYFVGVVVDVTDYGVLLGGAGVIPEMAGIRDTLIGQAKLEAEVVPEEGTIWVGHGGIIGAFHWRHNLPAPKAK